MGTNLQNNLIVQFLGDVTTASTSVAISNDIERDQVVTASGCYAVLRNKNGSKIERVKGDATGGVFTFTKRGLDQSDSDVEVSGLKKAWKTGQNMYITLLSSQIVDKQNDNIFVGTQTFNNIDVNGDATFDKTIRVPVYANATARDAAITSPSNGMECYVTADGLFYDYKGGAWTARASGSSGNASETVAGVVEIPTAAQRGAGTSVGETGARLVPSNDALVKTSSGSSDENKIPVLDATGKLASGFIPLENNQVIDNTTIAGENIAADKFVCRLGDGKVYEVANNERITMGSISGQTSARSHEIPNDKIVTICQTSNTLTAFVGTINRALNTVTYGSGYTITTQSQVGVYSVSDNGTADSFIVVWGRTTGNILECVANTISGTVVTTGSPSTLNTNTTGFPQLRVNQMIDSIGNGKCVCVWAGQSSGYLNGYARVISVSGLVITLGSETLVFNGGSSGMYNVSVVSMGDNKFYMICDNYQSNRQESAVCTVSGTTITAGSIVSVVNAITRIFAIASDRANNVYAIDTSASGKILYAYSVSGTTQTLKYSTTAFASTPIGVIVTTNNVLGIVFANSVTWGIEDGNSFVDLNTETYTRPLANFGEQTYSTHYFIWTESGNPTRIFKIANEIRNVYGYTVASINKDATGTIIRFGELTTGITNIPVGLPLYVDKSNGSFTASPRLVKCGNAKSNNTPFINISL